MIPIHIQERFHQRHEWDMIGCWNWTSYSTKVGYGMIGWTINGIKYQQLAHRMSYELYKGPIPDNLMVRHICDNPGCVNPFHLEVGTHLENMADMVNRNRTNKPYGIDQHCSVLTEQQVLEIRSKYVPGLYSMTRLAEEYGVWPGTIRLIIRNITWTHLLE